MLLILSDKFDKHADVVEDKLTRLGKIFFRLNLDKYSLQSTLISYDDYQWKISSEMGDISLSLVRKVWLRRAFVELSLEDEDIQNTDTDFRIWRAEWNKTLAGMYLDLTNAIWFNPIREAFRAENKYFQMQIAKSIGLKMPDIIVSNRKSELINFAEKHGEVALKLMSQDMYIDGDKNIKGIFVNKLTPRDFLEFGTYSENPIVLQKYIQKLYEIRYTVVGSTHHVCKIDSQSSTKTDVDWRRYDIPKTPHTAVDPPKEIRLKVNELMSIMGLEFGALDFIVTKNNDWYFLEINSIGQWLWIEDLTGLPISDSIVEWFDD